MRIEKKKSWKEFTRRAEAEKNKTAKNKNQNKM